MTRRIHSHVGPIVLVALTLLGSNSFADDRENLVAIKDAYSSNRNSFQHGWGRFKYRVGSAKGLDSVLAGKWTPSLEADVYWAFQGNQCRYDLIFTPEDVERGSGSAQKTARGQVVTSNPARSTRCVTDGTKTMMDYLQPKGEHQVQISPGTTHWENRSLAPLSLGMPSVSEVDLMVDLIAKALTGQEFSATDEGEQVYDSRPVQVILLKRFDNGASTRCWFDLERGGIPLRVVETLPDGNLYMEMSYTDLRQYGGNRWLPHRLVSTQTFQGKVSVKDLQVSEIDVDNPLPADALKLGFEGKTRLRDVVRSVDFEVPANSLVGIDPLPPIPANAQEIGPEQPVNATVPLSLAPVRSRPNWLLWGTVMTISLIVAVVLARVIYRRFG